MAIDFSGVLLLNVSWARPIPASSLWRPSKAMTSRCCEPLVYIGARCCSFYKMVKFSPTSLAIARSESAAQLGVRWPGSRTQSSCSSWWAPFGSCAGFVVTACGARSAWSWQRGWGIIGGGVPSGRRCLVTPSLGVDAAELKTIMWRRSLAHDYGSIVPSRKSSPRRVTPPPSHAKLFTGSNLCCIAGAHLFKRFTRRHHAALKGCGWRC